MANGQTPPLPPHNKRVEQYLLGCLFRDPEAFDDVRAVVGADHFYFDGHQRVFRAIEAGVAAGEGVDIALVNDRLKAGQEEADTGGYEYLRACRDAVPDSGSVMSHARRVREYATYRRAIHAANEVLRDAYDQVYPVEELAARAEQLFLNISDAGAGAELVTDAELIRRRLAILDSGGGPGGLPTGLADLDAVTGGLSPEEYVVVGARPSVGKTALGLTVATNVAAAGTPVLVVSLEMGGQPIGDRILSMRSGVPMLAFTGNRRLSAADAEDLAAAAVPRPGSGPIHVYDRPGATAAEIASVVRRAVRRRSIGLVVVDYIGLIAATNARENRVEQVSDASRRLKDAARRAGVPLLCLAQLNRKVEDRQDGRPKLSDLRESGSLEQDADKVILIHRKDAGGAEGHPQLVDETDLIVAKNRNGPTGDVTVQYRKKSMRFENAARGFPA